MTPWETLGISRDASAKQIRQAFQKLSKLWHPDRPDGDSKKMAEINHAYDILSSPQKKLRWERTGSSAPPPNIELQIRDLIGGRILAMLGSEESLIEVNPVAAVRGSLVVERNQLLSQRQAGLNSLKRARKRLKKLRFKGSGPDFITQMLEFELEKVEQQIGSTQDRSDLLNRALEFLDSYDYEIEVSQERQQPMTQGMMRQFITGATWKP